MIFSFAEAIKSSMAAPATQIGRFEDRVPIDVFIVSPNPRLREELQGKLGLPRWNVLEAGSGDEAQASEGIEASYDGDDMQIAFNPQYLIDGIGAIDSDIARVSFTTPTRPAVITGKGEAQPDYRYVLMPIRSAG